MIDEEVKKWLIKAMEDLKITEHDLSFPEEEMSTGPVCFHCQQLVEKLLKAYLVSKKIDFGKTHDLAYLKHLCVKQDGEFGKLDVRKLTTYAVEVRYPDDFYIPTIEEATQSFEMALNVKDFVFQKLEIK